MIILVGTEKGGTGKTTIATNLCALLVSNSKDILLIDADKQASSTKWAAVRDDQTEYPRVPSVQKLGGQIRQDILELSKKYAHIVIDAGGTDSMELRSALTVCDRVYIPIQPSQLDTWTLGKMESLIKQSREFNEKLEASIVINRASTNPRVRETEEVIETLTELKEINLTSTIIRDRIAYQRAAREGLSACELSGQSKNEKAVREIQSLYQEIFGND